MTSFSGFYGTWFQQLRQLIHELCQAPNPPASDDDRHLLRHLVLKVVSHYEDYYLVKSVAAERDVLAIFGAPWGSALEHSLYWVAGWRPTTLFHLVYTQSSILFESHIMDILCGHRSGDLGDLSPIQFRRVSEVQCETVRAENGITEELSEWQESGSDMEGKMGRLLTILNKADHLRMATLNKVVDLLTNQQAAEFLIAAAELQFGVRAWGLDQDRHRNHYA